MDNHQERLYIVIPAYQPGDELIGLVELLLGQGQDYYRVLLVDDGSNASAQRIFTHLERNLRVHILHHKKNHGKGAALKTAFRYLLEHRNSLPVITADADGQHTPADILRVAERAEFCPKELILGTRCFADLEIPWRSRFGNYWSTRIFKFFTGQLLHDIQTGLRGIPADYLPRLSKLPQNGFDFESAMLLDNALNQHYPVQEIPIESVYMKDHPSHFRPLRDSLRIIRSFRSARFRERSFKDTEKS